MRAAPWPPPFGLALAAAGVALMAASIDQSIQARREEGLSWGWSIPGGLADFSGAGAIYAGFTGRDIMTGRDLGLSPIEQGRALGAGIGQGVMTLAAVAVGVYGLARGLAAGVRWGAARFRAWRCASGEVQVLSRGAQMRAKLGTTFDEYMHFRGQGFTPAQAKYLTQPYDGWGHHFLPRRWGLPEFVSESPLNVMKPEGISIGRFYERHFLADPHFSVARFPKAIGGNWEGSMTGLQRPWFAGNLWYGSPRALRFAAGGATAAGGAAGLYWWTTSNGE